MAGRTERREMVATRGSTEKARRRRFDQAYRLRIVEEADRCSELGQIGELLRREGLYSSQLATWRRQRSEGSLTNRIRKSVGGSPKSQTPPRRSLSNYFGRRNRLRSVYGRRRRSLRFKKKSRSCLGFPCPRPTTTATNDRGW